LVLNAGNRALDQTAKCKYTRKENNTMSDSGNEFGAFLAGFVIGGLVGAAVALLTTPQTGEETRSLIHDKSIELKDKAVERAETARVKAEAAAAEARARADEITQMAKDRAGEISQMAKDRAATIKASVQRKPSQPATPESPAE
jgi:gas vesicle protein